MARVHMERFVKELAELCRKHSADISQELVENNPPLILTIRATTYEIYSVSGDMYDRVSNIDEFFT